MQLLHLDWNLDLDHLQKVKRAAWETAFDTGSWGIPC